MVDFCRRRDSYTSLQLSFFLLSLFAVYAGMVEIHCVRRYMYVYVCSPKHMHAHASVPMRGPGVDVGNFLQLLSPLFFWNGFS